MQTYDKTVWLNAGKFRANHGIGYVPKPGSGATGYLPPLKKNCKIGITLLGKDNREQLRIAVHGEGQHVNSGTTTGPLNEQRSEFVLTAPEHAGHSATHPPLYNEKMWHKFLFTRVRAMGTACS